MELQNEEFVFDAKGEGKGESWEGKGGKGGREGREGCVQFFFSQLLKQTEIALQQICLFAKRNETDLYIIELYANLTKPLNSF